MMLSLRNTAVLAFAAVVAIPLIVFWAWPRSTSMQVLLNEASQDNLRLARTLSASLDFYHSEVVRSFEHLVEEADSRSEPLRDDADSFCYIAWADAATGKILRKLGFQADQLPDQLSAAELAELKANVEFGRTAPARLHTALGAAPELRFARAKQGVIVFANLATSRIGALARAAMGDGDITVTVLDPSGRVMASANTRWQADASNFPAPTIVDRLQHGEQTTVELTLPGEDEPVIASAYTSPATGWSVIATEPVATAASAGDSSLPLPITVLLILMAALVGSLAAAPIVGPLLAVSRAAHQMQGGDKQVRIPALSRFAPTELVELSRAFNAMAESVMSSRRQEAEARARAEGASQSKSEFLRNVTHEIRTPLNAIIGFSEVLLNECRRMNLPHRQLAHAEDICSAGRHMLGLINSVLDLSRIEAGQYQLQEGPTAVDEVIGRCIRFLGPAAQARGTRIEMDVDPELPDVTADERALFQSILNLAANAVRYGREGGRVLIAAAPSRLHGLEITVSDDGPGIPEEYLDKVMEPFVRVASEANRGVEGSGLGLPIVKKLAELHGGSFVLESTVGAGTIARIRLPAARLLPRIATGPNPRAA